MEQTWKGTSFSQRPHIDSLQLGQFSLFTTFMFTIKIAPIFGTILYSWVCYSGTHKYHKWVYITGTTDGSAQMLFST